MGCDIHLYFEIKNKDGKWEEIKIDPRLIPDDRNYRLFAFLADVRTLWHNGNINPQFKGRGIPDDTSMPKEETEDFWIGEHSFTYAYLDEILKAPWKESELEKCYFYIFCEYIIPKLVSCFGSLNKEDERNIRVIMGFDN